MRKNIFKKIRLISRYGFFASNLLNIGAMESEKSENKYINEIKTTVKSEVDKLIINQIKPFSKKIINSIYKFINNLDLKNYKIKIDQNGNMFKIGTINPINFKELEKENINLVNEINKKFNNNFIYNSIFNSPLDDNIRLRTLLETINNFPFIEKLCNIYSKNGYLFEINDFYKDINETDSDNIVILFSKYKKLQKWCKFFSGDTVKREFYNKISGQLSDISLKMATNDYFFNRLDDFYKETNLNGKLLLKINEDKIKEAIKNQKYKKLINKEYFHEFFKTSADNIHEFNHVIDYILEVLTLKKNDHNDILKDNYVTIFENIHKIIFYLSSFKKIKSYSEIVKYINNTENNNNLKKLFSLDFSPIKNFYDDYHSYSEIKATNALENIRTMLKFGNEEQQCKLIQVLSYIGNFTIEDDENFSKKKFLIQNNFNKYGCKNPAELLAVVNVNAILSDVEEDKEYAEIILAFSYCWVNYVLEKTKIDDFNKLSDKFVIGQIDYKIINKYKDENIEDLLIHESYYQNIIKYIKNNKKDTCNNLIKYKEFKNKEELKKYDFYNYFTITLNNEELKEINEKGDLSELASKYTKRIKYSDYLECCYSDFIMNKKKGLNTFIFENKYKEIKKNDNSYKNLEFETAIVKNKEIEEKVKKIEKLMKDFYKFLFKEDDENLSKFNVFEKMQLLCFFYKLLDEKNEYKNYITLKEKNNLFNVAINGIIKDIIKTNLNKDSEKYSENIISNKLLLEKVSNDKKYKEDYDSEFNLNRFLNKLFIYNNTKEIDKSDIKLYVNSEYLENIKNDKFEDNNNKNIEEMFVIVNKINKDYFYYIDNSTLKIQCL